jgi:hypothetical protein
MRTSKYFSGLGIYVLGAIVVPIVAQAAPVISSMQILTPTVNVNRPASSPRVKLAISGKGTIIQFLWQGPSGELIGQNFSEAAGFSASTLLQGYLPAQIGGQGFETEFSPYSEAGTWTLASLDICDADYNCGYYSPSQSSPQTFKIINDGEQDIVAPEFLGGVIETPTVSLLHDPTVRILIHATDNVSGVGSISVCITLPAVGVPQLCANIPPPLHPNLAGDFVATLPLPATTATGVYTVQNVYLVDIAGNFRNINNPGQISGEFNRLDTITVTP